jgi:CRISPR-associated protein Cas2
MFVSIAVDFSSEDHFIQFEDLVHQYGFKKILRGVYESTGITEKTLLRLKRDVDKISDGYDIVRLYQYPVEDNLVLSHLEKKKWRKTILKK